MKIAISRANAFQIDPAKKYLVLVTTPEIMTKQDVEDANTAIRQHFPNLSVVSFKPGTRYKVLETEKEE
ncbi:MAG: hypothetical protein ACYDER_29300 [Ktedonobacteraceae bacterium]